MRRFCRESLGYVEVISFWFAHADAPFQCGAIRDYNLIISRVGWIAPGAAPGSPPASRIAPHPAIRPGFPGIPMTTERIKAALPAFNFTWHYGAAVAVAVCKLRTNLQAPMADAASFCPLARIIQ